MVATSLVASVLGLAPNTGDLDFVRGRLSGYLLMLTVAWTSAAFGEELLFRGFALDRLHVALGGGRGAAALAVALQALLFGLGHAYQGLGGVVLTGVIGLGLGAIVRAARGNLWIAILAHGLIDTLGLTALFLAG